MRGFGDYADDDTASAIKARDYKDATDLVVGENYARPVGTAVLGSEIIGSLNAVDYKWPQNQQLDENKFIVVDEKPILIDRGAFNQGQNALYKPIISDDPVIPSLVARGPHAVATFTPTLSFDTQFGSNANVFENQSPTLKASQAAPSVAIPIHDQATRHSGKRGTKSDGKGNGFGIGNEGDPMNTLTSGDRHAVAYTLREREGKPGGGKGPLVTPEKSGTLAARSNDQTVFQPQAVAYDEYNDTLGADVHHALRAGTKQSTGVVVDNEIVGTLRSGGDGGVLSSRGEHLVTQSTMAVRRLTPIECERLMGWPDGWTEGQADTHRYKQCGNGIASPVAQWIAQQLLQLDKEPHAPPTTTTT
jgi:DNA (cytosine-5)-methyltransferase 1